MTPERLHCLICGLRAKNLTEGRDPFALDRPPLDEVRVFLVCPNGHEWYEASRYVVVDGKLCETEHSMRLAGAPPAWPH